MRKQNTPEKFWSRVLKRGLDDCWEWQGAKQHRGHGHLRYQKRLVKAHRLAYELTYGSIEEGVFICHKCNNPPCCNPKHLYAGSPKTNVDDSIKAGTFTRNSIGAEGEKNPNNKLTKKEIKEIRKMLEETDLYQWQIAEIFNCSQSNVSDIKRNRIWKEV